jgi:potassium-dependent mechanosensitive channel
MVRVRVLCLAGLLLAFLCGSPCLLALEDESWKSALQQLQEAFQSAQRELKDYDVKLKSDIKNSRKGLARLDKKRGQMMLWFGNSYDPEDLNHLLKGIGRLRGEAEDLLQPFRDMQTKLEIFGAKLAEIEVEITRQLTETPSPEYSESLSSNLEDIGNLKVELAKVDTHMGQILELHNDFAARLDRSEKSLRSKVSGYLAIYYLQPLPSVFSQLTWSTFKKNLDQWLSNVVILRESLGENREWLRTRDALLQGLALATGLIFLGWALISKAQRPLGATSGLIRLLFPWTLLSLSAASLWVDRSIPFTLYGMSATLSEILLSAGLVSLCSELHSYGRGNLGKTSGMYHLWYFWVVIASGLLLVALDVPYAIGIVVWPLVMIVVGWRLRLISAGQTGKLERWWTASSPFLFSGLALLTITGFATLSVIIVLALFYLLLAVVIVQEVFRLVKIWEVRARESGQSLYTIGCISGIGFPAVILGLFFLNLWLVSLRLGGRDVFLEILSFRVKWQNFGLNLEGMIYIVAGFYLTRIAIFISDTFLSGLPGYRPDLDKVVIESLLTLVRYIWWGIFALYLLFLLGIDLTSLAVIAGGLSVGIGFGLQHIVNNFFSGLILLAGRSIQSGDTIQIGSILGNVRKVTIRNTVVQTRENATLFIPNSDLITNQLINWSHRDRRVVREIHVGVAYGTDTEKVTELLLKATGNHHRVLPCPAPEVLFCDFGASCLDFKVKFWIENVDHDIQVLSDIRFYIDRLFRENAIECAYPQSDVHLRTAPALDRLWKTTK